MSLRVGTVSMADYQNFLARADITRATVYHNPLWLEAVQVGLGMNVTLLGVYDDPELLGVLPGFLARKYSVRLFGAPLRGSMTPYLGWLFKNCVAPRSQATLDQVGAFCTRALSCQYIEVGFMDAPPEFATGAAPDGWQIARRETYMVDLRAGEAALWKNLESRGRNKVRKATKSGLVVESVTDRSIIEAFYPMLEASYARHHAVPQHPKAFFLGLHERLVPAGLMEVLAAKYQGQVVAVALLVHDDREVRCMSSASLAEFHHLQPNNLVQWHGIQWAAGQGLARYDLGGKGQPTIDSFKETFRPSVHAFTFYWRAKPLVALARRVVLHAWPGLQSWRYRIQHLGDGVAPHGPNGRGSLPGDPERERSLRAGALGLDGSAAPE
jgi:CelD/BcsL family acetyltransferase involved in cellulose biosynthesis